MRFARPKRARRRPGLTPLIDVVFLLLVFFMLATRFETESLLPLAVRVSEDATPAASGIPVLRVDLDAAGRAAVAGAPMDSLALARAFATAAADARPVRLRPVAETPLQPLVELLALLRESGAADVAIERDAIRASGG